MLNVPVPDSVLEGAYSNQPFQSIKNDMYYTELCKCIDRQNSSDKNDDIASYIEIKDEID